MRIAKLGAGHVRIRAVQQNLPLQIQLSQDSARRRPGQCVYHSLSRFNGIRRTLRASSRAAAFEQTLHHGGTRIPNTEQNFIAVAGQAGSQRSSSRTFPAWRSARRLPAANWWPDGPRVRRW